MMSPASLSASFFGLWGMCFGDMRHGRIRSWLHARGQEHWACLPAWNCMSFICGADLRLLPHLPSQYQDISTWEPACQWLWLKFKNADKAKKLGAMVFECLAGHFVGLAWLNLLVCYFSDRNMARFWAYLLQCASSQAFYMPLQRLSIQGPMERIHHGRNEVFQFAGF